MVRAVEDQSKRSDELPFAVCAFKSYMQRTGALASVPLLTEKQPLIKTCKRFLIVLKKHWGFDTYPEVATACREQ